MSQLLAGHKNFVSFLCFFFSFRYLYIVQPVTSSECKQHIFKYHFETVESSLKKDVNDKPAPVPVLQLSRPRGPVV